MKLRNYHKAKLIKLSVCDCGFPLLNDDIPIGTVYYLDLDDIYTMTLICGGCGIKQDIESVHVMKRAGSHGGHLPRHVFETESGE
jgi:hypothetical protein